MNKRQRKKQFSRLFKDFRKAAKDTAKYMAELDNPTMNQAAEVIARHLIDPAMYSRWHAFMDTTRSR